MDLVLIKRAEPDTAPKATASAEAPAKYHCPMHPQIIRDTPADCPSCGMKLVLIKRAEPEAATDGAEVKPVDGRVPIVLSAERQQRIGLTTAQVERRELARTVRASATVQPDETKLARVAARFNGFVVDLKADYTGQALTNGQPLVSIYSLDLQAVQNDYQTMHRAMSSGRIQQPSQGQKDLAQRRYEFSRRKLELWNIADEEIKMLESVDSVPDECLLRSPISGHVLTLNAYEGLTFRPGDVLYEIADLSRVWLRTYIFEQDLQGLKVGQKAHVTFPYLEDKTFETTIAFIAPRVDPQTRRAEVRLEVDNTHHELRFDMWANVQLEVPMGEVLAVPASAVLDTGRRFVAFVSHPNGRIEPRNLAVGTRTDEYYEVLNGLEPGEKVVTRALFLVDSESQLEAAIMGMTSSSDEKCEHCHGAAKTESKPSEATH
jgi:Cu(I)/Ag(I) efflux system membrane fusion protein